MEAIKVAKGMNSQYKKHKETIDDVLDIGTQIIKGPNPAQLTLTVAKTLGKFSSLLPPPFGQVLSIATKVASSVATSYLAVDAAKAILDQVPGVIQTALNEVHRIQKKAEGEELIAALASFEKDLNAFQETFNGAMDKVRGPTLNNLLFPPDLADSFKELKDSIQNWKNTIDHELNIETHGNVVDIKKDTKVVLSTVTDVKENQEKAELRTLRDSVAEKLKEFSPRSMDKRLAFARSVFAEGTLEQKSEEVKLWYNGRNSTAGYLLKADEGTGKTVFASKIGDILQSEEDAPKVVYFLPQRNQDPPTASQNLTNKTRRATEKDVTHKPLQVIAAWAQQLSKDIEFARVLDTQPILETKNGDEQEDVHLYFQDLIVDPCERTGIKVVLVLDAIDYLLSRSSPEMEKLIACLQSVTSPYVRFIITASTSYEDKWENVKGSVFYPLQLREDYITAVKQHCLAGDISDADVEKIGEKLETYPTMKSFIRARNFAMKLLELMKPAGGEEAEGSEDGASDVTEEVQDAQQDNDLIETSVAEGILFTNDYLDDVNLLMEEPIWKSLIEFSRNFHTLSVYDCEPTLDIHTLHEYLSEEGFNITVEELLKMMELKKHLFDEDAITETHRILFGAKDVVNEGEKSDIEVEEYDHEDEEQNDNEGEIDNDEHEDEDGSDEATDADVSDSESVGNDGPEQLPNVQINQNTFVMMYDDREADNNDWITSIVSPWIVRAVSTLKKGFSTPYYTQNSDEVNITPLMKYFVSQLHNIIQINDIYQLQFSNEAIKAIRSLFCPETINEGDRPYILLWLELLSMQDVKLTRQECLMMQSGIKKKNEKNKEVADDLKALDAFFDELSKIVLEFGEMLLESPSEVYKAMLISLPTNTLISQRYRKSYLDKDYVQLYTDREDWSIEICRYETDTDGIYGLFGFQDNTVAICTKRGIEFYSLDNSTSPMEVSKKEATEMEGAEKDVAVFKLPGIYMAGVYSSVAEDEGTDVFKFTAAIKSNNQYSVAFLRKDSIEFSIEHPGPIHLFMDDREKIFTSDVNNDNVFVVTTSRNRLYVWEEWKDDPVAKVKFDSVITAINMDYEAEAVMIGLENGKVIQWSKKFGEAMEIYDCECKVTKLMVGTQDYELIIVTADGVITLYNMELQYVLTRFAEHDRPILECAFDTEDKILISVSDDFVVKMWNMTTFAEKSIATKYIPIANPAQIQIKPAERLLLCTFADESLPVLCDLNAVGYDVPTLDEPTKYALRTTRIDMNSKYEDSMMVGVSKDANIIVAIVDGFMEVYNSEGKLQNKSSDILEDIANILVSDDGQTIVTYYKHSTVAHLWNIKCEKLGDFNNHVSNISSGFVSIDGNIIMTGSVGGNLIVWNKNFEELQKIEIGRHIEAVTINDDQSLIALSIDMGDDQCEIRIIDMSGEIKHQFFVKYDCNGLRFNENSTKLLISNGTPNHRALVYDFINDIETEEVLHCFVQGSSMRYADSQGLYEFNFEGTQTEPLCYFKNNVGMRGIMHSDLADNRRIFHYFGNEIVKFSIPVKNIEFKPFKIRTKDRRVENPDQYWARASQETTNLEASQAMFYSDDLEDTEEELIAQEEIYDKKCPPVQMSSMDYYDFIYDTYEEEEVDDSDPALVEPFDENGELTEQQIKRMSSRLHVNFAPPRIPTRYSSKPNTNGALLSVPEVSTPSEISNKAVPVDVPTPVESVTTVAPPAISEPTIELKAQSPPSNWTEVEVSTEKKISFWLPCIVVNQVTHIHRYGQVADQK
ncbi:hypothetical protein BC833DRAFT_581467 [Globomyces pollinis-pini]|nr:hypothetical protein BC833DRAFT_581467 [Globomyces pollinis-pini]